MGGKTKINRYRYDAALKISKELAIDGMIIGNELTEFIKGLGIKFKTENDLYEFESMLLDCLEDRKKYIIITDTENNTEYKFEKAKDASLSTSIPVENIRNSLYKGDLICGRFKARYGYWTTKDLTKGVRYYKGIIDFDYYKEVKKGSSGKNWSRFLNSKIKVTDTLTGIPKTYKDGYAVCSVFKIDRKKITDCVSKKCKLNGRFVIELIN